ncbi:MAG TPA: NAD(P)H-hydrate dehydratase [Candidatus Omnitrophota bacterium]|nr:NAD(P)H-hydrate dehydratase [Candidatus Omnitrophota bacterium]
MRASEFRKYFPPRKKDSHKGCFGRIFILSGSRGFPGAPYLTGMGALRAGAGLITLGVPRGLYEVLTLKLAEVMTKPFPETAEGSLGRRAFSAIKTFLKGQDVLALGPGLSQNTETQGLIRKIILACDRPMVIDADGLNAFQGKKVLLGKIKAPAVLTPHPGEAARLFGLSVPKDPLGRKKFAAMAAESCRCVLVLKGAGTVVASPGGKIYVNDTGNPGLATGGSGDLLTGIIAAFLGQGLPAFDAAKCGVFIHGLAADLAVKEFGEISLAPRDVLSYLPLAFKKLLKR